jgi:alpha-beta hydrolase superfamily lysophospholipase
VKERDAVLDVEHMPKYAKVIGEDVKVVEVKQAVHDMVLSKPNIRKKVYSEMYDWLKSKELL